MAVTVAAVSDLAKGLQAQLDNPAKFTAVSTRVLLRTGVSLREPRPDQDRDPALVTKVRDALAEMGYAWT
jgi:hypothetical protein